MTNHKKCYVPDTFFPVARQEKFNFISCRLQDQAQRQLKKGGKFEDLSAGDSRPSSLVERYDNLYTQTRLDAMDELDEIESLDKLDDNGDIKNKILFSVVVVSEEIIRFQAVTNNKVFDRSIPHFSRWIWKHFVRKCCPNWKIWFWVNEISRLF